jgi:hypothetical protein
MDATAGSDMLTEVEIKKVANLASPPIEDSNFNQDDRFNEGASAVKSNQSRIEELIPEERYRHGERIGSNLNVICIIRKSQKNMR